MKNEKHPFAAAAGVVLVVSLLAACSFDPYKERDCGEGCYNRGDNQCYCEDQSGSFYPPPDASSDGSSGERAVDGGASGSSDAAAPPADGSFAE